MQIKRLDPIGYCGGVNHAIDMAISIRKNYPERRIAVFGMIIHNRDVCDMLSSVYHIDTIDTEGKDKAELLRGFGKEDIVIFTAHGHDDKLNSILDEKGILYFDAVCPFVKVNMDKIRAKTKTGQVIFIGKKGHPETEASLSISENVVLYDIHKGMDYSPIHDLSPMVTNQTTLSFLEIAKIHQDIREHLPKADIIDEICNATRKRQERIASYDEDLDLLFIVGSEKSSNTSKLYEVAKGNPHFRLVIRIDNADSLDALDLKDIQTIGIAGGTSTSLKTIEEIERKLTWLRQN